jgi:hypothetical protein
MTILYVNTGTSPNQGDGDSLRVSFDKINQNFRELDGILNDGFTANIVVGNLPPVSPLEGALWFDTTAGKMFIYYDSFWVDPNPDAVAGPQGPLGPRGFEGVQGLTGDTGSRGPQGPQGVQGPQGPQGPVGVGLPGIQGIAGPVGPSGPQGIAGSVGPQGSSGPQGAASTVSGPQGPIGPQGSASTVSGPQGPSGPSGPVFQGATDVNISRNTQSTSTSTGALTVVGGVGIGRNLFIGERISINQTEERYQTLNGAIGVVDHNCALGQIFNHIGITADFTANLTNLNLDTSYATNITLILNQGTTSYTPTALQIGGVAQIIYWQGNTLPPDGSPNKKEVVSFSILNDGGTYTVFGQLVSYG